MEIRKEDAEIISALKILGTVVEQARIVELGREAGNVSELDVTILSDMLAELDPTFEPVTESCFALESSAEATADKVSDKTAKAVSGTLTKLVSKADKLAEAGEDKLLERKSYSTDGLDGTNGLSPVKLSSRDIRGLDKFRVLADYGADLLKPDTITKTRKEMMDKLLLNNQVIEGNFKTVAKILSLRASMSTDKATINYVEQHVRGYKGRVAVAEMWLMNNEHKIVTYGRGSTLFGLVKYVTYDVSAYETNDLEHLIGKEVDMRSLDKFIKDTKNSGNEFIEYHKKIAELNKLQLGELIEALKSIATWAAGGFAIGAAQVAGLASLVSLNLGKAALFTGAAGMANLAMTIKWLTSMWYIIAVNSRVRYGMLDDLYAFPKHVEKFVNSTTERK